MKTRLLCVLMCVTLLVAAMPGVAMAAGTSTTCSFGSFGFVKLVQTVKLYVMVAVANAQVDMIVARAQATPYDDVQWMLARIDSVVNPVFAYAKSIGATVVCEYEQCYVDGQYVTIDPLRVVNI